MMGPGGQRGPNGPMGMDPGSPNRHMMNGHMGGPEGPMGPNGPADHNEPIGMEPGGPNGHKMIGHMGPNGPPDHNGPMRPDRQIGPNGLMELEPTGHNGTMELEPTGHMGRHMGPPMGKGPKGPMPLSSIPI